MAQLTQDAALAAWIDDYLDYLIREWKGIPLLEQEWDEWDEHSKLVFVLDWGVPSDRLSQLRVWADQGLLSSDQRRRYDELRQLVAQHGPWIERILAE
jgi:hypothetical protein